VPALVRWPGTIKAGSKYAEIMSHEDWIPTLMNAAGVTDIKGKLKKGYTANGKKWKVHLDGYDFTPLFTGKAKKGPREEIMYFSQGGELNAVRWNDWKVHFAVVEGNIATGVRSVPGWPVIFNLKADPYEVMTFRESMFSARWYADQMWLFVPIGAKVKEFLGSLEGYPFQAGSAMGPSGINYNSLKALKVLKQLEQTGFPVSR
jgi:arylsulfatase